MNSHVPVKGSFLSETFSTLLAGEGTLSSMNSQVLFKSYFMSETFSTLLAGEGTLLQCECSCA